MLASAVAVARSATRGGGGGVAATSFRRAIASVVGPPRHGALVLTAARRCAAAGKTATSHHGPVGSAGGWAAPTTFWRGKKTRDNADVVSAMCKYASEGRVLDMQVLMEEEAVNVNQADYDKRTPLHLAASEGHVDAVKFLLAKGAFVNATDRFGGTPLSDAMKARHSEAARYLRDKGARINVPTEGLAETLCLAAAAGKTETLRELYGAAGVRLTTADYDLRTPLHLAAAQGHVDTVKYLLEAGLDPLAMDRFGHTPLQDAQRSKEVAVAVLLETYMREHGIEPPGGLSGSTGGAGAVVDVPVNYNALNNPEHCRAVGRLLAAEGVFSQQVLAQELEWFYSNLALQPFYFERYSPEEVAKHLHAYVSAKQLARGSGRPNDVQLTMERADGSGAFYLCASNNHDLIETERAIDRYTKKVLAANPKAAFSITHFISKGPAVPHGNEQLAMYVVDTSEYVNKECAADEAELAQAATKLFMETKNELIKARYEDIMEKAVRRISPVLVRNDKYRDDTVPVMVAFRRDSVSMSMWEFSELFDSQGITCERKMVETFANGINVYSMYLHSRAEETIQSVLDQVSLLFLVPQSTILTPLFLSQELSAEEYAYASSAQRFVYYFLQNENEDIANLYAKYDADKSTVDALQNISNKIRHVSVSNERIAATVAQYPDIVRELFRDFHAQHGPGATPSARPAALSGELQHLIGKTAEDDLDAAIFNAFAKFNASVEKCNFFKNRKAALAYRLHPSVVLGAQYRDTPYGIFLLLGNDFHGFHVRFQDVARGGIRLIHSANRMAYQRNNESLLWENYSLAHTQNRKNKDIPEFGSKGTVLLHSKSQTHREHAFKKYISGLVDLLLVDDVAIVDHLQQQEILFLGPDENTADLMEWAALYAKKRGYPYWKAITTGKPASMGGIPHDTYGMTTNSVHKFVTELLLDEGEDETQITKLQTGGPDGDLGSNEILISHDRTVAVVDGSGVLANPDGLDREELSRLARTRKTISNYEGSLGAAGFKVLVSDHDVPLPSGELVENGMVFRNEFHLHPLAAADLFVPCGGRPESVNASNVHRLFDTTADGNLKPRFKYIVEGANLFFTQEARNVLASKGVVLFKDASANKGGVTSSSLEVLAALVLNDEEHSEHMCVKDAAAPPPFYQNYVQEVQERIRQFANDEFHCITREHRRTGIARHLLTDEISDKINELNLSIARSTLWENPHIRRAVMAESIPSQLVKLVGGLDEILRRVPDAYAQALFRATLSSKYVYKYGLAADEFAFFQFMDSYVKPRADGA